MGSYYHEITYTKMIERDYDSINQSLAHKDTLDIITWAYHTFEKDMIYACSFGAEGMVLIDLISKVRSNATIVFLDTHFHFKETYQLIEKVGRLYPGLTIEMIQPTLRGNEQAERYGDELWKRAPDQCCHIRKVEPLQRRLLHVKGWISGVRREQSPTRAQTRYVNPDHTFKSIKICPLIHWTWDDVWTYIRDNQLPYNSLHDQGYSSIGCEYCTLPVQENQRLRAGRWAGLSKTECGLHNQKEISEMKK